MAKIAELHNGTQIHFPDSMPDSEMDAAVQRHLGLMDPDITATFVKALTAHAKAAGDVKSAARSAIDKDAADRTTEDRNHKVNVIASAAHVEATRGVSTAMQEGLNMLAGPLAALADASEQDLPRLVGAIEHLATAVVETGKAIITAMMLPKEIEADAKGKPRAVRVVQNR